jgi:hypothetical protein
MAQLEIFILIGFIVVDLLFIGVGACIAYIFWDYIIDDLKKLKRFLMKPVLSIRIWR